MEKLGFDARDKNGESLLFASWEFPKDQEISLLDAFNPDAVEWWKEKTLLWGVDGWKEDAMISATPVVPDALTTPYHDGFANEPMKAIE